MFKRAPGVIPEVTLGGFVACVCMLQKVMENKMRQSHIYKQTEAEVSFERVTLHMQALNVNGRYSRYCLTTTA